MPRPTVEVLIKARDLASSVFGRFQRNVAAVGRIAKNVARDILALGAGITGAVVGLRKMAESGAEVVAVKRAFAKVTEDETGALQRLRDATADTVSDFDLMRLSNQAVALGAARSAEEFGEMARQARLLGRAQGLDATEALEKYTVALARQSKLRLDDLGIVIDQQAAEEKLAARLGKSADQLDESEKALAFRTAAMERGNELVEEMSAGELGAVEAGDRLATTIDNIRQKIVEMVALSPRVSAFFESLGFFLDELSGNDVAVNAILGGINRIDDLRVLQNRMLDLSRERQEVQSELGRLEGRFEGRRGRIMGNEAEFRRLQELRQRMRELDAVLPVLGRRITTIAGGGTGGEGGGAEGGVAAPALAGFDATQANLRGLLTAIRDTKDSLAEARLAEALAQPGEEAEKATEKVRQLNAQLEHLRRLAQPSGGELGLAAMFDPTPLLSDPSERMRRAAAGLGPVGLPEVTPLLGVPPAIEETSEGLQDAGEAFDEAGQVAVASLFAMGEAAVRGSDQVASSVVNMISSILQALPGVGGVASAVIGGVGGLVSAALGRRDSPVPVRLSDVEDRAAQKLNNQGGEPIRVTTIIEQAGIEIERIERELFARQDRDETVRFGASATPLRR